MSVYQVTKPAASVKAEDGTPTVLYQDALFDGALVDVDHLKMLVDEKFVVEIEVPEPVLDPADPVDPDAGATDPADPVEPKATKASGNQRRP